MVRIGWLRMIRVAAFLQIVGSDVQHLFLCEQICDLRRASPLHAKSENALDHLRGFLVHDPFLRVVRIFDVAEWDKGRQWFSALTLGLDDSPHLPAGVACIELVEPHANPGKIVVHAVLVERIKVVVDRNIPDIVLGKGDVDEHARHRGVSPKAREVFRQDDRHMIRFDLIQHFLEAGTIKIGSTISVVDEENGVRKLSFACIVAEDAALVLDAVALSVKGILV